MNIKDQLLAVLTPEKTAPLATAPDRSGAEIERLKKLLSNRDSIISNQANELQANDKVMTAALAKIKELTAATALPVSPPQVTQTEGIRLVATRGSNWKIHLLPGDQPMRFAAVRPTDNLAVHFDKIPTSAQKHQLGVNPDIAKLFVGLSSAHITDFRCLFDLATQRLVKTPKNHPKTWVCGRVYETSNCYCEDRQRKATERKATELSRQEIYNHDAIECLRELGIPLDVTNTGKPGRSHYYDYDASKGTPIAHKIAQTAKSLMANNHIEHAGYCARPYNDMIALAVKNGIAPQDLIK